MLVSLIGENLRGLRENLKHKIRSLDKQPPEGVDSSGVPLKLSRYAKFLSLYVNLHYKEIQLKSSETRVSNCIRFTLIFPDVLLSFYAFTYLLHIF